MKEYSHILKPQDQVYLKLTYKIDTILNARKTLYCENLQATS